MKLKMLAVAMVCALASVMISESADAQHRGRGRHGGNGYGNGYGNGNNRYCPPRYAAPQRVYYNNNNCGPRYNNRQVVYRGYNNCPPRYTRVMRPTCAPPPVYNNYGGYSQGGYYGGNGVSVNVNTPGFSGSFNSGGGGYYRR